ncbi:nucleoside triphosphate pyrophosphohydrolase [Rhodohalobacter mucosus]|uniref:Nucleoside triphosphate pyrophosphohydrolase n=1 Tax=Rhodohalobacter mucosus TaxID=2079485 RepID=A0A316TRC0_9BACT|nr:nucleoside triphosphate pyrophosphohydrolase [Rhodohalobacter mucosus]PWN07137.1 nucleoside triphosphate pyrophosphohydrolase [Rhodohalobacter mucosus]
MKPSSQFEDLVKLIAILRKECPWDKKQTHQSIKDNLIEEAYEAVEAIEEEDFPELKKELGDLLLHVIFQSKMAAETDTFTIDDVIYSISEKLIRRHPHVFDDTHARGEKEVATNWEAIKLKEGKKSVLDGVPRHLPGLIRAQRMQEKASNVGFDWTEWELAWTKLNEEIDEWREAVENQSIAEQKDEFGDLLFSLVNVGRLLGLHAEESIRLANKKFDTRFRYIEETLRTQGRSIVESNLDEMDKLWNEAKELKL